jgi:hypothetical protein
MELWELIKIAVIVVSAISGWIIGVRLRRRARRALGRELTDAELTSFMTWMSVNEAEERLGKEHSSEIVS